jgi:hypothetical protein
VHELAPAEIKVVDCVRGVVLDVDVLVSHRL